MARINIEDTIYTDGRFLELVRLSGSVDEALGSLVRAWAIAQRFYIKPEKMIPLDEWKKQKLNDKLITVTLATVIDGFVRMAGIDDQFSWLTQRVEAGRKGGLARQATAKRPLPTAKAPNSLLITQPQEKEIKIHGIFDFEAVYNRYPKKLGKSDGLKRLKKTVRASADYNDLNFAMDNFLKHHELKKTKLEFIPYFSTWASTWQDWVNYEATIDNSNQPDFSGIE